jgi:outer membrane protein assembly factor BamB
MLAVACTSPAGEGPSRTSEPPASPTSSSTPEPPAPKAVDWTTFGFDLQRTGVNPAETVLDARSLAGLRLAWSTELGGAITAPPVVAGEFGDDGLVLVGTAEGDFFALDAADGTVVWRKDVGAITSGCEEFPKGRHGVTGSAVLDLAAGRVHVAGGTGEVFAFDIASGELVDGWPVSVTSDPTREHVFGALTLSGGSLYVTMAGVCDAPPFKGKVVAIDVATARRVATFFPTGEDGPSGGGIWGVGGVSVDPSNGDVFVATGNAVANPEHFGHAEAVVRLTSRLRVVAANYPGVTGVDADFGATPLLFRAPGCPPQLAVANKDGELFLYRRDAIARGPTQRLQIADAAVQQLQGVPAYSRDTGLLYVSDPSDADDGTYRHGLLAFEVRPDCTIGLAWQRTIGRNNLIASPPVVAGGVVYVAMAWDRGVYAFDAVTGRPLWDSARVIGGAVFAPPVVVNGLLYQGSWDGRLYGFALAP